MALYEHTPHPRIEQRHASGPVTVAAQLPGSTPVARFNTWLAVKITTGVGTMWCAYAFTVLALISLPAAIRSGNTITIISWIAQTFLQLVLLSVIMVGQNILGQASDKRAEMTYKDAEATFHEAQQIQAHLKAQDDAINAILDRLEKKEAEQNKA